MTREKAIFAFVIEVLGEKKVCNLLKKFGFEGKPTPEILMETLDKEGKAFAVPFGKLMKQAASSPKAKAAGQAGAGLTPEQRSEQGLQWFNAIADLFGTAINSVDDIANATNGTDKQLALAELQRQERLRQEAQQKTTLYWILGGIGLLLVVIIFVVALTKRQ